MNIHDFPLVLLVAASLITYTLAQGTGMMRGNPYMGMGPGMMMGNAGQVQKGSTMGMGMGAGMNGYGPVMHALLSSHVKIQREYAHTEAGIESITWSEDPAVTKLIQQHVQQMTGLLDGCARGACPAQPRFWDPLFAAVYKNAAHIDLQATNTPKGVHVVESGDSEAAKLLVQAHAAVVSKFVKYGMSEAMQAHEVP